MSRSAEEPAPRSGADAAAGTPAKEGQVAEDLSRVFGGWGVEGEDGGDGAAPPADAEPATAEGELSEDESVFRALAGTEGSPEDAAVEAVAASPMSEPIEDALEGLRTAVNDLAQRPSVDLGPLVFVMRENLAASSRASTALTAVASELREFTQRVEATPMGEGAPKFYVARERRTSSALLAIALLIACWALVLWLRTGNSELAIGTLAVAALLASGVFVTRA